MTTQTLGAARTLAQWAVALDPSADDLVLADRSLTDTVAVAPAAHDHPTVRVSDSLSEVGRWAVACHILDFDDLHMDTTTHVSTVCVPVAGDAAVPGGLAIKIYPACYALQRPTAAVSGVAVAVEVELETDAGTTTTSMRFPPGSPQRPPTDGEFARKIEDCLSGLDVGPEELTCATGAELLQRHLTHSTSTT
jgi:hypothetical protein